MFAQPHDSGSSPDFFSTLPISCNRPYDAERRLIFSLNGQRNGTQSSFSLIAIGKNSNRVIRAHFNDLCGSTAHLLRDRHRPDRVNVQQFINITARAVPQSRQVISSAARNHVQILPVNGPADAAPRRQKHSYKMPRVTTFRLSLKRYFFTASVSQRKVAVMVRQQCAYSGCPAINAAARP